MGEKVSREELKALPLFRIVDGDTNVDFNDYGNLYTFLKKKGCKYRRLLGTITGCAELVFYFGEFPLRYVWKTHRIEKLSLELEWADIHGKENDGKEE